MLVSLEDCWVTLLPKSWLILAGIYLWTGKLHALYRLFTNHRTCFDLCYPWLRYLVHMLCWYSVDCISVSRQIFLMANLI